MMERNKNIRRKIEKTLSLLVLAISAISLNVCLLGAKTNDAFAEDSNHRYTQTTSSSGVGKCKKQKGWNCFSKGATWFMFETNKGDDPGDFGLRMGHTGDYNAAKRLITKCREIHAKYFFVLVVGLVPSGTSKITGFAPINKGAAEDLSRGIVNGLGTSTGLKHYGKYDGKRSKDKGSRSPKTVKNKQKQNKLKDTEEYGESDSLVGFCYSDEDEKKTCTRDDDNHNKWWLSNKKKDSKEKYMQDKNCHKPCYTTIWDGKKPVFVAYNKDTTGMNIIVRYGSSGPVDTKEEQQEQCGGRCTRDTVDHSVWYDSQKRKVSKEEYKNDKNCHEECKTTIWKDNKPQFVPYNTNTSGMNVIVRYGKPKNGPVDAKTQAKQCGTTTTLTTTTPPPPSWTCGGVRTRQKADTETRIAVENMSLDGVSTLSNAPWRAKGARSSLPTDTDFTPSSGEVYTIAKPGDSVHFLHMICMNVRYGRKTSVQDSWVSGPLGYGTIYNLPTSWAKIGGIPNDDFMFGDGVYDVNSQAASVTKYENLFHSTGSASADSTKYGIGTLSPSKGKTDWNCNGVFDFDDNDPFIAGGFQIPGFDSRSCASGNSVGNNNLVGTKGVFGQYHEFNSLKIWENQNHDISGGCSCGDDSAVLINGTRTAGSFEGSYAGWGYRMDYDCKPKRANNCNCTSWHYDKYGNRDYCLVYSDYSYPYTDKSFTFNYHTMHRDYGTMRKVAYVYTPYNFTTSVESSIDSEGVVQQGGSITSSFSWDVEPRENELTSSFDYATVTPPSSKVRIIEFLYDPETDNYEGDDRSPQDPCSYYNGQGAIRCSNVGYPYDKDGNQNEEGYYEGKNHEETMTRAIPDDEEYIGFKYCVAVGIYPAESHNYEQNTIGNNSKNGTGMRGGDLWNISNASCKTIAKKPNYQVWNGSVYTEGSVSSSMTSKMMNTPFHRDYNGSANQIFGSWVDYAIIAGNTIEDTATGAGFGYENSQYTLALPGGTTIGGYDYALERMAISNDGDDLGHSNVNASASINTNLQRLFSRYKDKAASLATSMNTTANNSQIITSDTGFQFVYAPGKTLNTSSISKEVSKSRENPNYNTVTANGNIYKSLSQGTGAKADNTLVIVADTVNINGDICTGAPCGSDSTRQYDYAHRNTNAAATIPQILIFANNINISENVTRVDAWLVADNGTVNTCSGQDLEAGDSGGVNAGYRNVRSYNAGTCAKTLMVNGPVYARDLKLNRTAGAHHGSGSLSNNDVLQRSVGDNGGADDKKKGSIAPAEIFNLRADVYLWAYNQAERSSEAVVTYVRELAPRY